MQAFRGLLLLLITWGCIIATFKGYPLAFISWLGILLAMGGWSAGLTAIFHPMGRKMISRFYFLVVSILVVLLGESMISWGGAEYLKFFDSIIHYRVLAGFLGIISGLFNMDRNMAQ